MRHDLDDVKLTAYALGELTNDEARDVEALLATDADARRKVEAIRATAGELTAELAKEPLPDAAPAPRTVARRWPTRLALAAAASVVVGGVTASVLMPTLNRARETARVNPPLLQAGGNQAEQATGDRTLKETAPHAVKQELETMQVSEKQRISELSATVSDLTDRLDVTERERRNLSEQLAYVSSPDPAEITPAAASGNASVAPKRVEGKDKLSDAEAQKIRDYRRREQFAGRGAIAPDFENPPEFSLNQGQNNGNGLFGGGNVEIQEGAYADVQRESEVTLNLAKNPSKLTSDAKDAILLPADRFVQDGAGPSTLRGVIRERRNIAGAEYATISVGSVDKVTRGTQFHVVSNGAVLGKLTVEAVTAEEATGRLEGLRIVEVKPGDNVQCAVDGRQFNTEAYDRVVDNAFLDVVANPLSTFSIDVDTASYSNVRRFLTQGQLPPKDAVRIEEMVNYFPYDYAAPAPDTDTPFNADVEVTQCPWKPEHRLVRVALKGMEIAKEQRPPSNLVFLIDVSGSMKPQNKLPLLKESMKLLVHELKPSDRVAMVVYAGSSGIVLQSTPAGQKDQILAALDRLEAGGSTNGAQGIELAYSTAVSNFIKDGINRVILCTDGDFNVGVTNQGDLTRLIEEKAKTGVFLSVLGFGMGNVKDSTMEKLADKGNGNYAYIDTLSEGKKVLVDQMSSTLVTIAKDVKIQIEFNPAVAGAYRLIGYENRMLAKDDFNDDKKDAGEIGAGHTVTALYEIVPAGQPIALPGTDPLKYQSPATKPDASKELMTLKLRYKAPDGDVSKLMEVPVTDGGKSFAQASGDLKFASGVAAFGMILRDSPHKGSATFGAVLEWAEEGRGEDEAGYRKEFVELVKKASALKQ